MKRLMSLAVLWMLFGTAALPAADTLDVGDAAPKLQVNEFVKGEPVPELKTGQVYVVEFWATWCGPCIENIPHLSKLQKKYGEKVTFIGVSVFEQDVSKVVPFVKKMGEKMEYRVATDKVGKDEEPDAGYMAKNWLTAAGQDGIPAAFIVNKEGKIAWIGHPAQIDKTLKEVVEGNYDLNKAVAAAKKDKQTKAKLRELGMSLNKVRGEGPEAMAKLLDEALKQTPELEETVGMFKYNLISNIKEKQDDAVKYGQRLVNEVFKDDAGKLNEFAWMSVNPQRKAKPTQTELTLALKAAQAAAELTKHADAGVLDTLACAYFASGDKDKAIATIEKALKIEEQPELKQHLELFKASK